MHEYFRSVVSALVTGLCFCLAGERAKAQEEMPHAYFDCAKLVQAMQIGNPATPKPNQYFFSITSDEIVPKGSDTVSATELFDNGKSYWMLSDYEKSTSLGCILILVELISTDQNRERILVEEDPKDPSQKSKFFTLLPVLLINRFDDKNGFDKQLADFKNADFQIPFVVDDKFRKHSESSRPRHRFTFENVDYGIEFLSHFDRDEDHVSLVSSIKRLEESVSQFLRDKNYTNDEGFGNLMLAVCGGGSCRDAWDLSRGYKKPLDFENALNGTEAVAKTNTTVDSSGSKNAEGNQVTVQQSSGADNSLAMDHTFKVNVSYSGKQGLTSLAEQGFNLECIFEAIVEDLFVNAPNCDDKLIQEFKSKSKKTKIEILSDGQWVVRPQSGLIQPRKVIVRLSPAADKLKCELALIPFADDRLEMEPVPESEPPTFELDVSSFELVQDEVAKFKIEVSDSKLCATEGREFEVSIAEKIEVELTDSQFETRSVAYVFTLDDDRLSTQLKLSEDRIPAFSAATVNAVEAAQVRLSAGLGKAKSPLVNVSLYELQGREKIESLLDFQASGITTNTERQFEKLSADRRANLATEPVTLSWTGVVSALGPIVREVQDKDIDALTISLIGMTVPRMNVVQEVCEAERYDKIQKGLDKINGVSVSLWVFPSARLGPEDAPDLLKMGAVSAVPPAVFASAVGAPVNGGLYRCYLDNPKVQILPYFVEHWRSSVEVPSRVASALSDQLAEMLFLTVQPE